MLWDALGCSGMLWDALGEIMDSGEECGVVVVWC